MMKNIMIKRLLDWFKYMLGKYPTMSFEYEYSESRLTYRVVYWIGNELSYNEDFNKDVLTFERELSVEYGDYTPLFCENGSIFHLSENAVRFDDCITIEPHHIAHCSWTNNDVEFDYSPQSTYNLAA